MESEKENNNTPSNSDINGFELSGADTEAPERERKGDRSESEKNIQPSTPSSIITSTTETAFIDLLKLPFRFVAALRDKSYWELNEKESITLKKSSHCIIKFLPPLILKYSCLLTFLVTIVTFALVRIKHEKKDLDLEEEEEDEEEEEEEEEDPITSNKKLGRGTRQE